MSLINRAFKYVLLTSAKYNIDESHSVKHSIEVLNFANKIYKSELSNNPYLNKQYDIICMAAILHDMCDKKYMNEEQGIYEMKSHMNNYISVDNLDIIAHIIQTMSYSTVRLKGYPQLGIYQLAYHIVREADLLAAYDIDRCVMYSMYCYNIEYSKALNIATELFDNRVFRMRHDKLFKTKYSKKESLKLHKKATIDVESLKNIYNL